MKLIRPLPLLLWLCVALVTAPATLAEDRVDFLVVVHASNPSEAMERRQVAKLFLKISSRWSPDLAIEPVDQGPRSPVQAAFTKHIYGKSVTSIMSYWQRTVFSGRGTPPARVKSDQEVLEFVRSRPGAVGYISAGTRLVDGVRVLEISDLPGYDKGDS